MRRIRDNLPAHGELPLLVLLALVIAPFASASTSACKARAVHLHESIHVEALGSWEPLDERTLLIWTSHETRAHLVRLEHPIPGLASALTIFLVAGEHERTVCACGRDAIMVQGSGLARIASIRYLSRKQTAQLDPGADTAIAIQMTFT
ncbi:MAG TPA: DUF6491 family protein [Steroidobacteraceae bacterium]|jgi:hypothetical protein